MKFFNIQNTEEFLERVQRCSGKIRSVDEDGTVKDLKETAEYLIRTGLAKRMKAIDEIDLRIEDNSDMDILFSYALGMGRERICA